MRPSEVNIVPKRPDIQHLEFQPPELLNGMQFDRGTKILTCNGVYT